VISAFGVDHGISKGIPKGLPAAAGKGDKYALNRLRAHNRGKIQFGNGKEPRQKARLILRNFEQRRGTLP
jgi:hypothetical protein